MEKRQLDLNAPFLSVRRYSSPSRNSSELVKRKAIEKPPPNRQQSLPVNKSDWECEEVTKPAAVPFHWEQIPGRPKGEVESPACTPEEPLSTPRLPPGRLSDAIRRSAAPSRYNSGDQRFNDHQNIYRPQESFGLSDHATLLEKLSESLNCKDDSGSESGDDAYSDALDTLSGSWSFNYSVSGISGGQSSGVKPSGTFAIDTQTRDFMMNRFLPAAKAVVIETPKHVAKKSTVSSEQPKPVKKVVSGEMKKPLLKQYGSNVSPRYSQYIDNLESEDDDEPYPVPVKKPGKTWGILPRFCVKNSLCLLNPLPAMKSKSRPPTPSAGEARRLRRNAHSGPLDKNACHVPQKKKFHSGLLTRDLLHMESKQTNESNQLLNYRDSYKPELSPLRRYRSGSISPYRNESPKSPFREGSGFLGIPKEVEKYNASKIASSRKLFKALQDVSRNQMNERGSADKASYIDSVNKRDIPISKSLYTIADQDISKSPKYGSELGYGANRMEDVEVNKSLNQESAKPLECTDLALKSPLQPPLPKSPSESWLWRTLPSIPLGNPFSQTRKTSQFQSKKQGQKGPITDTKWETIVKSSNLRPDHVRYSEELIPNASFRQRKS